MRFGGNRQVFILMMIAGFIFPIGSVAAEHNWEQVGDPGKIVGPEACIECHKATGKIWEQTHHFSTFKSMPRSDRAREIADNLGITRIKTESLCLSCHYTSTLSGASGKSKPIAGISCESCHGAGKDWINIHGDYGGLDVTRETESPEHRSQRLEASEKAGMIRPGRMYAWASNCYNCHTVPQERLVNVGGHPAGSKFELVSWSQGEVRHNVWFSGGENLKASPERKRMMYITGQALDLAYALRGIAKATEKATYSVEMAKRAKVANLRLKEIDEAVSVPEIKEILKITEAAKLSLNNEGPLMKAANEIAVKIEQFTENYDGSTFSAVDPLIPPQDH